MYHRYTCTHLNSPQVWRATFPNLNELDKLDELDELDELNMEPGEGGQAVVVVASDLEVQPDHTYNKTTSW